MVGDGERFVRLELSINDEEFITMCSVSVKSYDNSKQRHKNLKKYIIHNNNNTLILPSSHLYDEVRPLGAELVWLEGVRDVRAVQHCVMC